MPYDERLADRIREQLADERFTEQPMFGGLAFLIGGHMSVAAAGTDGILARVPEADYEAAQAEAGVHDFVMRGKPMKGWLRVGPEGVAADADLARWCARGVAAAKALPPK